MRTILAAVLIALAGLLAFMPTPAKRTADLGDVFGRTLHPCTPPCAVTYDGRVQHYSRSSEVLPLL